MTINLKIEKYIYNFFHFLDFFCIYLEIHCEGCQNNPLSMDPHSCYFLLNVVSNVCGINVRKMTH
jgi:hypothetical protein